MAIEQSAHIIIRPWLGAVSQADSEASADPIRYKTIRRRLYDNPFKSYCHTHATKHFPSFLFRFVCCLFCRLSVCSRSTIRNENENGNENKSIHARRSISKISLLQSRCVSGSSGKLRITECSKLKEKSTLIFI